MMTAATFVFRMDALTVYTLEKGCDVNLVVVVIRMNVKTHGGAKIDDADQCAKQCGDMWIRPVQNGLFYDKFVPDCFVVGA